MAYENYLSPVKVIEIFWGFLDTLERCQQHFVLLNHFTFWLKQL